jgi:hypothetical protein
MSMSPRRDPQGIFNDTLMLGGLLSIVFLAAIAKIALATGVFYILFPELAALSYDVFTRPAGAWARSRVLLMITPTVTAALGTALTQLMPYNLWSAAITIAGAILIVRLLRSPIVPAISAAFLPLAFGITSWWYPASIAAVMILLALASTIHCRISPSGGVCQSLAPEAAAHADGIDDMARAPWLKMWPFCFVGCLLLAYGLAVVTGLRLILFPPLVVIAFEMFAHAKVAPWVQRPFALPLVCTIAAAAGLAALLAVGAGPLSVVISLLAGIVTLRAMRLHFPPALAVGLLPQIMPHADWYFVLAIALGATTLAAAFLLARPVLLSPGVRLELGD